jgi:cytochrome P450
MIDDRRVARTQPDDLLSKLLAAHGKDEGRMSDRQVKDEILRGRRGALRRRPWVAGYRIPKWTHVLVSPYATQRRAAEWPLPEAFDPERFKPDAEARRPRHAFIAFGAGLRPRRLRRGERTGILCP